MSNCINRRKLVPERVDRGGTLRYAWLRAPPLRLAIKIKPKPRSGCLTQEAPYEGGLGITYQTVDRQPRKTGPVLHIHEHRTLVLTAEGLHWLYGSEESEKVRSMGG